MTHRSHGSAEATVASVSGRRAADTLIGGRYEILEETERPGGFAGYKARHVLLDSLRLLTALPDEVVGDTQRLARVRAAVRAASWPWADLMRRAFGADVLACPRCGGRMIVLATIEDPAVIHRILTHLGLSMEAGEALPAPRASPSGESPPG